jgi:hypothetical protein
MVGAIFKWRSRIGYLTTLIGLFILVSAATVTAPSFAQKNSEARAAPLADASVAHKGSTATEKRANSPRRRRGGPESPPGNEINAMPAEGQSDLIKVLQPASRQTKK